MRKQFPKDLLWKDYKPYIFTILLDPREKFLMLEKILKFNDNTLHDIREEFFKIYTR